MDHPTFNRWRKVNSRGKLRNRTRSYQWYTKYARTQWAIW